MYGRHREKVNKWIKPVNERICSRLREITERERGSSQGKQNESEIQLNLTSAIILHFVTGARGDP